MKDKKKKIAIAMCIVWDSLRSHLGDTYDPEYDKVKDKRAKASIGNRDFHRKCVKEYATVIKTLSELI